MYYIIYIYIILYIYMKIVGDHSLKSQKVHLGALQQLSSMEGRQHQFFRAEIGNRHLLTPAERTTGSFSTSPCVQRRN